MYIDHNFSKYYIFFLSSLVSSSFPLTQGLKSFESGPLSPHYEAKQKVRENLWDMYFTDNGW